MQIYCCQCQRSVNARLTDGKEIYRHRPDLKDLPFWRCNTCKNFVGCHHRTNNRTKPLGNIPTKKLKEARRHIHEILDPIWSQRIKSRQEIYRMISDFVGYSYHTAEIKSLEEARKIYRFIKSLG